MVPSYLGGGIATEGKLNHFEYSHILVSQRQIEILENWSMIYNRKKKQNTLIAEVRDERSGPCGERGGPRTHDTNEPP